MYQLSDRYTKDLVIPSPPTRDEQFQYLGKQPLRVLAIILFVLSVGSVYGIWAVFSKSWQWYPFLLILVVLIPWSIYVVVLATFRPRVTWETHTQVLQAGSYMLRRSVDVFLPVCGEELSIIRNSLVHISKMEWPGRLTLYCLDDKDQPSVKHLAEQYGFTYLVRSDRPLHKKSGNMNYGLSQSSGEFICVFDADFAPAPEFLLETVPYMLYDNLGIVQTAQYFDVKMRQTRNWIQQLSGSTQDMFFCWAQPARNTADASMCVGTNVVYRRKALDTIGGFPRVSSGGEDIVTGLDMYAKGYRTIYLPLALAKGVCPDDFNSCVNQQYRWASTSMKMFAGKNEYREAFKRAPLNIKQKIVFWSGVLYYSQSILVLITAVLPSLVMLWFFPWLIRPGNYLPIAPAMLGMFALPLIIRGWRPATLRLVLVYSVSHTLSALDVLRGHTAGWVATGDKKRSGNMAPRAGWVLRTWVAVFQLLTWIAIIRDLPLYSWSNYWTVIIICGFQTVVLLPLLLPNFGTVAQPTLLPHLIKRELKMFRWRRRAKRQLR